MDNIEIARSSSNEIKNGPKFEDRDKESVDNFQKFFYELFEKNGILNDLRAYLRRHIVDVLKNSNAGDTPMCQKHFTQRLELKAQALNILVAEYLMCSELNYTLSVFVSEIPLANMVFEFAGSLMKGDGENNLRFKDKDVWSIIQHLGIKCDSKLVTNIVDMYKNEKQSLLLCIIKSLHSAPAENTCVEQVTSSEDALSEHSSETLSEKTSKKFSKFSSKCQHYALCKGCHCKLMRLKEKYKKRKDAGKTKESSLMSMTINSLMKNINNIEGSLVNEMFDQLKSVYESELEMMHSKQERRVQQALKEHAHSMRQQRQELEEAFKARELDLERGVRAKKKFLWGLARTLRAQHDQLARAMIAVKYHTQRLRAKEEDLKAQLSEVEHLMQTRGDDMQVQITSELVDLQRQLDIVKKERDSVNREKAELENLRQEITSNHANIDIDEIEAVSDTAWTNFDLLKKELSILRDYNDTPQDDKCVTDKSTVTEDNRSATLTIRSTEVLNNEQEIKPVREEDRLKNNQLVNDFKKQKNVNFRVGNAEDMFLERRCPIEEPHRPDDNALAQLTQENERLREYARQQEQQVAQLGSRAAQLQAELCMARAHRPQPPTAPAPALAAAPAAHAPPTQPDTPCIVDSVNEPAVISQLGWRCCGGGEETTLLKCIQPRVFVPGDTVPFIGLLHERHNEPKRLMNQWRCARRSSPLRARTGSPRPHQANNGQRRDVTDKTYQDESSMLPRNESQAHSKPQAEGLTPASNSSKQPCSQPCTTHAPPTTPQQGGGGGGAEARARSPKSVLREAKEKLRAYPNNKYFGTSPETTTCRDKSPTTVLREAKLRLRKLEIEAEAVEKSYMDYRKRQSVLKNEREYNAPVKEEAIVTKDIDGQSPKIPNQSKRDTQNSIKKGGINCFLQEYRRKLHLSDTQCANNIATAKTKPIPEAFSSVYGKGGKGNNTTENYLEAPMAEFQKFYRTSESFNRPKSTEDQELNRNKHRPALRSFPPMSPPESPHRLHDQPSTGDSLANEVKQLEAKKEALNKAKNSKKFELEILKRNITQMYHYDDVKNKEEKVTQDGNYEVNSPVVGPDDRDKTNLLRIEVENVNESNEMRVEAQPKEVLVVVQSTVEQAMSDVDCNKKLRGNMTILISPKRSSDSRPRSRSASPEQAANLTRNDVLEAIYQADPVKVTSNDEICDAAFNGEDCEGDDDDYPDDFSADVDNNNDSRNSSHSPLSAAHSPEETPWDDSQTYP